MHRVGDISADPAGGAPRHAPALVRYLDAGRVNYPFHPHGSTQTVVNRDGAPTHDATGGDARYGKFLLDVGPGQSIDSLENWKAEYDPAANKIPADIQLPQLQDQIVGPGTETWFSENPYLGAPKGDVPTGIVQNNVCGEYYHVAHSHALHQATNYGASFGGMMAPDYTGVPAAGTKTYTLHVTRPGTYLYQAGHLGGDDPGPREVAMGLAGALVVRPAGAPVPGARRGRSGSGFEDEAVLMLSEIDPLFAAHPLTYDLRLFRGTYRLTNGTAFPQTQQIGTAPSHRVLLRYVNAGVSSASMGPSSGKQVVVAQNGYPATGAALVANTIAAGSTEDAAVTVPTAGARSSSPTPPAGWRRTVRSTRPPWLRPRRRRPGSWRSAAG